MKHGCYCVRPEASDKIKLEVGGVEFIRIVGKKVKRCEWKRVFKEVCNQYYQTTCGWHIEQEVPAKFCRFCGDRIKEI